VNRALSLAAFLAIGATTPVGGQSLVLQDDRPVIVLPDEMATALQRFDAAFEPRQLSDYPPWLWREAPCQGCGSDLYEFSAHEAPFAVIGDFNGDTVRDVVIDGDNHETGRRLVILSSSGGSQVSELDVLSPLPNEVRRFRTEPDEARDLYLGLGEGLSRVGPGTVKSPWETEVLVLTTDAFIVSYYEKAGVLYYYRDGTWHRFTVSD
jgi:hypothetical protein